MAKTVPTAMAPPSRGEILAGKPVLKSTWQTLIEQQHYTYGRQGNFVMNAVFDPAWTSLAHGSGGESYSATGATNVKGMQQLDQHTALFVFQRLRYLSAGNDQGYMLDMYAYAQNLDVKATCVRLDTEDGHTGSSTTVHTLTTSHSSSDAEWQQDTQEFTKSEASRGGSTANGLAFFLVYVEAKVPASGTGYLFQLGIREAPITAGTNLPRGA